MVDQQLRCAGVRNVDVPVEVQQELGRCGVVVGIGVEHIERDDGHSLSHGSVELHDDPRAAEHTLGLEEHKRVAALHSLEEKAQVMEVI